MIRHSLNGQWQMKKTGTEVVYQANVPTTMYEVLLENNVIEDPFYGENDVKLTALSDDDYTFYRDFEVDQDLMACDAIELEFQGLDTLATIRINGRIIAQTNNMHRTYRFQVKDYLRQGTNHIVVEFKSPTQFIAKEQMKDPLWGIETTMDGYEHLRKGHHMFGWDWGPQLPDMGIWRDVTLYGMTNGKIEDFYVVQMHEKDKVELKVQIAAQALLENMKVNVEVLDAENTTVASTLVTPIEGFNTIEAFLVIDQPNLWWPNGYGTPYLYRLSITLLNGEEMVDKIEKRIGLRTITMHRETDTWGETFDFKINGVRIFAMGADYIPEDALITRPDQGSTRQLIKHCAKANYNCLRVWGGGIYPNDLFYDLCDEYGLIVWQDFMFACGVYRLTKAFRQNITAEFIDNIKRIRHHACLGLWCGNNEMEWAFVEWDLPKDERLRVDYLLMYEKLIPEVLDEYDPQTFYWPASPSSGGGFDSPNDDNKGDVHYWSVFHGNEHYKKFREHYFRFASEYGMQAFPDMKTVKSYAPIEQRNVLSPIMENHNKCIKPYNGNIKILMNMAFEFLLPKETEDIVYISQIFQGETIKCAVEHFRRNRGRCMGSTYWQVNDNYPVASWASIDYYGRWKALHYYAKRFYAPVLLSACEEGTMGHVHLSNEQRTEFSGKAKWQLRHIEDGVLESGTLLVSVEPLKTKSILDVSIDKYVKAYGDERSIYLSYQLYDNDGNQLSSETLLFTYHKYFKFQTVTIDVGVIIEKNKYFITLTSNQLAKSVGIHFKNDDILLSNNYFDILPGESVRVEVEEILGKKDMTTKELMDQIEVMSVNRSQLS